MLARSAEGLYWMGRYLERAGHLCRLLRLQTEALVDRPIAEIYAGWSRIYRSLDREPPGGTLEVVVSDDFTLADSFTLADDLTFEPSNPDSIRSCFVMGRENARQMRHYISGEMWLRLNLAYLRMQGRGISEIWRTSPEGFYAETEADIDTFMGTAAATMYRDLAWRFVQLGRFIERAQALASLLLTQLTLDEEVDEPSETDWTGLLRLHHALEAYNRHIQHRGTRPIRPWTSWPPTRCCPTQSATRWTGCRRSWLQLDQGLNYEAVAASLRLAGRLSGLVHHQWPDSDDHGALLCAGSPRLPSPPRAGHRRLFPPRGLAASTPDCLSTLRRPRRTLRASPQTQGTPRCPARRRPDPAVPPGATPAGPASCPALSTPPVTS